MPRSLFVILILLALIVGGAVLLSGRAKESPTRTIEVDVPAGNAS